MVIDTLTFVVALLTGVRVGLLMQLGDSGRERIVDDLVHSGELMEPCVATISTGQHVVNLILEATTYSTLLGSSLNMPGH